MKTREFLEKYDDCTERAQWMLSTGDKMTLQEAYRVLRRNEDFRTGFDQRCVCDAFPSREYREAVQLILASRGLGMPIINCVQCVNYGFVEVCKLRVKGECTKFEEVKGWK